MRRLLHPFVLVVSAVLVVGYLYIAARLTSTAPVRAALAAPFIMVWILPAVFWGGDRDRRSRHEWIQTLSFLCAGWVSFVFVLTIARDALLLMTAALPPLSAAHTVLDESGAAWVPLAALAAVGVGMLSALRGPYVRRVDIPVAGLAPDLDGIRIVQISDLHAGPTMRRAYVQRVVDMTRALAPDLVALTGDIVDGSVSRLASRVAPLQALTSGDRAFFVLGNTTTTRGRRRGRSTSRPWDFACSRTPTSPSRVARRACWSAASSTSPRECPIPRHGRVRTSRPTATRSRPSVCSWRTIRRSRRWPSRPALTFNCRDTRTRASSSRGRS